MPRFKWCQVLLAVAKSQSVLKRGALFSLNSSSPHYQIVGLSFNTVMLNVTSAALRNEHGVLCKVKAQEAERIHEEVALELCCVFALAIVWLISLLYALELDERMLRQYT